ncbi:creatininase family protein [Micromonospora sp. NPDC020750]|uniref:creatininase family protein n=1 Tax=unclassified Micromonospora TaxID=2617518 RepID=UPI00379D9624
MATTTDEANRGAEVAVLPVGSIEQHGDHLPLLTDTIVACAIAQVVAPSTTWCFCCRRPSLVLPASRPGRRASSAQGHGCHGRPSVRVVFPV